MSLANRTVFQMDQAIPSYQTILWHFRERRQNSNLDCYQRLCARGHCQERTQKRTEFRRNPANPSIVLFEKVPIEQVLTTIVLHNKETPFHNQLTLFDL